eukprot:Pgem_evm1s9765
MVGSSIPTVDSSQRSPEDNGRNDNEASQSSPEDNGNNDNEASQSSPEDNGNNDNQDSDNRTNIGVSHNNSNLNNSIVGSGIPTVDSSHGHNDNEESQSSPEDNGNNDNEDSDNGTNIGVSQKVLEDIYRYHRLFGYMSVKKLKRSLPEKTTKNWKLNKVKCNICIWTKMKKRKVRRSIQPEFAIKKGEYLQADLCGPFPVSTRGMRFFLLVKDRATNFIKVLKKKSDVPLAIYEIYAKNLEKGLTIIEVATDFGGEFMSQKYEELNRQLNITTKYKSPRTQGHTGLIERGIGLQHEKAKAICADANLSFRKFWCFSYEAGNDMVNMQSNTKIKSPFVAWHEFEPDLSNFKHPWGSKCIYYFKSIGKAEFNTRAGILLHPAHNYISDCYHIYSIQTQRVIVTRDYQVLHNDANNDQFPLDVKRLVDCFNMPHPNIPNDRVFAQDNKGDIYSYDLHNSDDDDDGDVESSNHGFHVNNVVEEINCMAFHKPKSWRKIKEVPDRIAWEAAVVKELRNLVDFSVFTICKRQRNVKLIPTNLICDIKYDGNGQPIERKVRGVVLGNYQTEGIHYDAVSSPVVGVEAMKLMFVIGQKLHWLIYTFDVKSAFFHSGIDKDIYLRPFPLLQLIGVELNEDECLKLIKSCYGSKQAALLFFTFMVQVLLNLGYKKSLVNPCIFYTRDSYVSTHVDDGCAVFRNREVKEEFERELARQVCIKYMNFPKSKQFELVNANEEQVPISQYPQEFMNDTPFDDVKKFQSGMGHVGFLVNHARPDGKFAYSILASHSHNPTVKHWKMLKKVMRYFKSTPNHGIRIPLSNDNSNEFVIDCWVDSSFQNDRLKGRSRQGIILYVNNVCIYCDSSWQDVPADSSTEEVLLKQSIFGRFAIK